MKSHPIRWAVLAGLVVVVAIGALRLQMRSDNPGLDFSDRDFYELIGFGQGALTGEYGFDSLQGIAPNTRATGKWGQELRPAAAVVLGRVIAVEPGVGVAGTGDIAETRTVAYDDPEAVGKWAVAVIEVDELLSGVLRARQGNRVRVEFMQPDGVSLDVFQSRLSSLGPAVWLIDKSADVLSADGGKTSPLDVFPVYARRTY